MTPASTREGETAVRDDADAVDEAVTEQIEPLALGETPQKFGLADLAQLAAPGAGAPRASKAARRAKKKKATARASTSGKPPRGTLSLSANLREHARKVPSTILAAKHAEVQVLQMSTVTRLVGEAVAEAVKLREIQWGATERQRLREDAEEIFNERLESFKAEKADVEARAHHFRKQLQRAQELLDEERQKVVSIDQFTVSNAGLIELEKRMSRLLDHACVKGAVSGETEVEMRSVVSNLLDDEREKIREKAREAQSEGISLLERKVERLASSLEETRKARECAERRAHALESASGNIGLRNVVDVGLDDDDPRKEKKLLLLKEIVQGNRDVRDAMKSPGKTPSDRKSPEENRGNEG